METQVTVYHLDRAGYPIAGPFSVSKVNGNKRRWRIYGTRQGVSATVLCQVLSVDFKAKIEGE